jgi:DNA-binding MarR family transcriptional regulator
VTTVVDGLVARGLVERVNDTEDRRRVNHALTSQGRKVLHHADEVVESGLRGVLDHLDPAGARDIAAGLGSLGETVAGWLAAWQPSEGEA